MHAEALLATVTRRRAAFEAGRCEEARRSAPDFTVFDYIRPGELRLSEILASLLDPSGTHGQGSVFLSEFLRMLELDWPEDSLDAARVQVEASTFERRRVDIVVRIPGAILGIENKPFAADQPNQVTDYLTWLDMAGKGGDRCLVYLANADGVLPTEGSISAEHLRARHTDGQFRALSYPALLPWLESARARCEAATVTAFVDALMQYIRHHFMGIRDMTEREQLVDTVRQSPETLRSALQIISAATDIQTGILATLESQIRMHLPDGYELRAFDVSRDRYTSLSIAMPGIVGLHFSVSFEGYSHTRLIYGVKHAEGVRTDLDVKALLDAEVGKGTVSVLWPWYRLASANERLFQVENDWRISETPWLEADDGTFAEKIIAAANAVRTILIAGRSTLVEGDVGSIESLAVLS